MSRSLVWSSIACSVILLGALPVVSPQSNSDEDSRQPDRSGDVKFANPAGEQVWQGEEAEYVDLTGIWFGAETQDTFALGVSVVRWDPQGPLADQWHGRIQREVHFDVGTVKYEVRFGLEGCGGEEAMLFAQREGDGKYAIECLSIEESATETRAIIPRTLLTNQTRVPLKSGDEITHIQAATSLRIAYAGATSHEYYLYDRAPDSTTQFAPVFRAKLGEQLGSGPFQLVAPDPVRVSNGEASTLVYAIRLVNHGDQEERVRLEAKDVDPEWNVRTPAILTVKPNSARDFPIILTLGSAHQHGETRFFNVTAFGAKAENFWTVKLGVHWLKTPQVSGHHNRVYIHSKPWKYDDPIWESYNRQVLDQHEVWMNPSSPDLERGATDDDIPRYGADDPTKVGVYMYTWYARLLPALLTGLDHDLTRNAILLATIKSAHAAISTSLRIDLVYCDGYRTSPSGVCFSNETIIASKTTEKQAFPGTREYEIEFPIAKTADFLPYKKGATLRLDLRLESDAPLAFQKPGSPVSLVAKKTMLTLPLYEYQDAVAERFSSVGAIQVKVPGNPELFLNPGRTLVVRPLLTNLGGESEEVRLEIEGVNDEWFTMHGSPVVALEPQQTKEIVIGITAPEEAVDHERSDVFLVAQSTGDPNVAALARIRATVLSVETSDIPDQSAQLGEPVPYDSPGPGLTLAAAAAFAAAVYLRRR